MAEQKHQVIVDGKTFTRRSPRPYRFAIVGTRDYAYDRAQAERFDAQDRKNYEYTMSPACERYWADSGDAWKMKNKANDLAFRAQYPDLESYRIAILADRLARLEARRAEGRYTATVLGWSQSVDNAFKMARTWANHHYLDVIPVPVGYAYKNGQIFSRLEAK